MTNQITVVTAIRNRESWRIRTMVDSIRATGADPSFHIVDYGSSEEYASEYKSLCKELKIKYTHMFAEGLPWNKCRALNFGAKQAKTPFIVTSDVDIIYENNCFEYFLNNYKEKTIFQVESYWLPKDGNKKKSSPAGTGSPGLCSFTSKKAFEEIGGYDERYLFWGYEDLDFPNRLIEIGYRQVWIPAEYKIYHQWHKPSETGNLRPATVSYNSVSYLYENAFSPKLKNTKWGYNITAKDRSILKYIQQKKPFEININKHGINGVVITNQIKEALSEHDFIKINLPEREIKKPFNCLKKIVRLFLRPIASLCGLRIIDAIDVNFDYIFEVILTLINKKIKDYYISDDFKTVYLLK